MTNRDIALATGLVFLMSVNLIVQKIAVEQVSIFVLSFLRVAMVIPLIFLYPKPKRSLWLYSLCGFFIFSLYNIVLKVRASSFQLCTKRHLGIYAIFRFALLQFATHSSAYFPSAEICKCLNPVFFAMSALTINEPISI